MIKNKRVGKAKLKIGILCINNLDKRITLGHKGKNAGTLRFWTQWRPLFRIIDVRTNFRFLGIDLGTTHSAVAIVEPGMLNTIEGVQAVMCPINMEGGSTTTPSMVNIQENGDIPLVGTPAQRK